MDDVWLDDLTLVDNLNALLGDKLWSHDQKKMYKKVELNKEPKEKLDIIYDELNEFYAHVAKGYKNIFGYVSYKNLQEYLEKL